MIHAFNFTHRWFFAVIHLVDQITQLTDFVRNFFSGCHARISSNFFVAVTNVILEKGKALEADEIFEKRTQIIVNFI